MLNGIPVSIRDCKGFSSSLHPTCHCSPPKPASFLVVTHSYSSSTPISQPATASTPPLPIITACLSNNSSAGSACKSVSPSHQHATSDGVRTISGSPLLRLIWPVTMLLQILPLLSVLFLLTALCLRQILPQPLRLAWILWLISPLIRYSKTPHCHHLLLRRRPWSADIL
jgi:hypothetical protein